MTWVLSFLEYIVPAGSVILSIVAAGVAGLTAIQTKRQIVQVREKIEKVKNSPVVEDHAELPGFGQSVGDNDVDDHL